MKFLNIPSIGDIAIIEEDDITPQCKTIRDKLLHKHLQLVMIPIEYINYENIRDYALSTMAGRFYTGSIYYYKNSESIDEVLTFLSKAKILRSMEKVIKTF